MTETDPAARGGGRARLLFLAAAVLLVLASLALFASAPRPESVVTAGADATAVDRNGRTAAELTESYDVRRLLARVYD